MYETVDVDNCAGSGSISLLQLGATFHQCVPVQPSTTYHFAYRFKGTNSSGTAYCRVLLFSSGNNCVFGQEGSSADFPQDYTNNNWIQASGTVTTTGQTNQAMIACSAPASAGYHDQLYFGATNPGVPPF